MTVNGWKREKKRVSGGSHVLFTLIQVRVRTVCVPASCPNILGASAATTRIRRSSTRDIIAKRRPSTNEYRRRYSTDWRHTWLLLVAFKASVRSNVVTG